MKKAWLELKNLVNSLSGDGLSDEALAVRRMSNNSKKLLAQKYAEALKVVSGNYVSENTKSATETPKTNSVKNQYAGERSLTKNSDLLEKAQTMYKNGADSEEIRQKTGWFKGYDGKWRYEIDDSKSEFDKRAFGKFSDDKNTYIDIIANDEMVLKHDIWRRLYDSGVNAIVRVEDVYKNDALFNAYPELKNLRVDFKAFYNDSNYGSYNDETNIITLNYDLSNEKLRSVIAHELQHAVQVLEGFAEGGTPAMFIASKEEIDIRNAYNQAKTEDEAEQAKNCQKCRFQIIRTFEKSL